MHFLHMSQKDVLLKKTLLLFLWLTGVCFFFRFLLVPLLPFLLASCFVTILEPWAERFRRAVGVTRSFAAVAVTTLTLLLVFSVLGALLFRLFTQLASLARSLPILAGDLPSLWNGILDRLDLWYTGCPAFLRAALDALARRAPAVLGTLGEKALALLSSLASALPELLLFLITTVLAVFFTTLSYPDILAFLKRQLPLSWQPRCRKAALCFRTTVLGWLRSQLILAAVTFLILLLGFTLLSLDYALLLSALTALVDALPVLGAGTVLIPWALLSLLLGKHGTALTLALLYAAVTLTRSLLEPRLLAGQADLPPISALLAMYLGFRLLGIGGMLLMPFLLLLVKQLQDAGVLRIWK